MSPVTHRPQSRALRVLLPAVFLLAAAVAQALPVIPGAAGYGTDTPAGRGGTVYKVTNLNASGTGSLKACIDGSTPRVCVFEVSGVIKITADLMIRYPYITIAGQTAPSPGIMLRGAALKIATHDVLVQHIRFRAGDDPVGPDPSNRDSLKLEGTDTNPVKNVVIDHCSVSWSVDEDASIWGPHDNITFSNDIFAEPLHDSIHPNDDGTCCQLHGYGVILDSSASGGHVTMVGNLIAHSADRNPLARSRELVFVNNLVYDRQDVDYDGQTDKSRTTKSTILSNLFLKGPSMGRATKPIYLHTAGAFSLVSGTKVYVYDNLAPDSGSSGSQLVSYAGGDIISGLVSTTTMPTWNSGLKYVANGNNGVYNSVLANVGARPTDRDSVDKRVVQSVRARTGSLINCVASDGTTRCNKNGGGWPVYAKNSRVLTVPANPSSTASNGYTNLENWLHSMDSTLQGVTSAQSPIAPASLSVD